jgi:hypothetical protein
MSEPTASGVTPSSGQGATVGDDHEQIRQLLVGYCHAVDRALEKGEVADVSALYHDDATFAASWERGQRHVGLPAVLSWYEEFLGKRAGYYRFTRHKISQPEIRVDGDRACSRTYFDADSVDRNDLLRVVSGRYDDEFVKQDGKWLIKDRYATIHYHYTSGEIHEFSGWG